MSIAQRFVAGEGETRAEEIETSQDAEALRLFSCDSTNLPWVIFRATYRATRVDALPQRARALLAALARTVDAARPYAAIYARRELITDRAMQSMRTLYRALADLEAAGFVGRAEQQRIGGDGYQGRYGRTYLHLTEQAATMLGLVEPRALPPESANVADGAIYGGLSPAAFQKRQPGQLPADLQRLLPLGFGKFMVFRLMREARQQGKRLSDVVEATWDGLKKAHHPICYLQALLRSKTDFGYQVRSRDAERTMQREQADELANAMRLARESAGRSFVDADGEHLLTLDAAGEALTVYGLAEGVARQEAGQWQLRFARALLSGRIRPASVSDTESFAQARRGRLPADTANLARPTDADSARAALAGLKRFLAPRAVSAATMP